MDAVAPEAPLTAAERRHGDRRNLVFEDKSAQWIVGSKTRHLPIPGEDCFCVPVCASFCRLFNFFNCPPN